MQRPRQQLFPAVSDRPLRGDLPARIAQHVRERIARGVLSPGVQLRQEQLATELGASRVPVREALKLLAAEGIVVHDPRRGFFVAELRSDELRQYYTLRRLVERELLSSIDWPNPEQLADLEQLAAELGDVAEQGDIRNWSALHGQFHEMIFELSPHKVLVREAMRLWTMTERYRIANADGRLNRNFVSTDTALVVSLRTKDREQLLDQVWHELERIEDALAITLEAREL